jgi:UDP-N-acetylglucosamine:LPS N-acetylglucosamine transferase
MKILAIASAGGHWVQLLRLLPAFNEHEIEFAATHSSFAGTVAGHKFYTVQDASRWDKLKLIYMTAQLAWLVFSVRPDVIISTGAAPGLMGVISGRLLGIKTVWVDSIANVEKLSLSGRLAVFFADRVYTQWPALATSKIIYSGNVL